MTTEPERLNRYDWHPWFAWYPVRLYSDGMSGGRVWLRWIECRIIGAVAPDGSPAEFWEFRK
jgi:hypothetical protein